jgi:hypothetical protein
MKEETFPGDLNSLGLQVKLDENLEKLDPFRNNRNAMRNPLADISVSQLHA